MFKGVSFLDYLNLIVNFGVIFVLSIWLINKSKVNNILEQLISFCFVLYMFVLHAFVTYVDISYYFIQEYVGNPYVNMDRINLIPFKTILSDLVRIAAPVTIVQTLGNLLLLTPLAFALLSLGIIVNKYRVILALFLTTLLIETYQLLHNLTVSGYMYSEGGGRAVDIDDILLNTMGGLIGILFFVIYEKLFLRNPKRAFQK